jgi:hypothetical protein
MNGSPNVPVDSPTPLLPSPMPELDPGSGVVLLADVPPAVPLLVASPVSSPVDDVAEDVIDVPSVLAVSRPSTGPPHAAASAAATTSAPLQTHPDPIVR